MSRVNRSSFNSFNPRSLLCTFRFICHRLFCIFTHTPGRYQLTMPFLCFSLGHKILIAIPETAKNTTWVMQVLIYLDRSPENVYGCYQPLIWSTFTTLLFMFGFSESNRTSKRKPQHSAVFIRIISFFWLVRIFQMETCLSAISPLLPALGHRFETVTSHARVHYRVRWPQMHFVVSKPFHARKFLSSQHETDDASDWKYLNKTH